VGGRAYGLELTVRRALTERVSGLLTYTLSRSEREQPHLLGQPETIPSDFDRTHVLNVAVSVDLGKHWTAGARFYAYSGKPYSPILASSALVPPYNAARLDPFHRLDLRLEKRWLVGEHARISFVAEVLNALLEQEAVAAECDWGFNGKELPRSSCTQQKVGPLTIPSVGVEAAF
jgi:hypothetical protein